ncbi:MAG: hypothetical protein IKH50_10795 [Oscillospiraceae bacterium]|nr:hypothetical protein [Oscillospiraceae bacterium]
MKKAYILAVCAAMAGTVLAGCGPAEENTQIGEPQLTAAETEETTAEETTAAETTATETAETSETTVSETTAEETTTVSETVTEAETAAEEKKEEEKKDDQNSQPENGNSEQPSDGGQTSGSIGDDDFSFSFGNAQAKLDEDLAGFIAANVPDSETCDPSCLGNGEDCIYSYAHFKINGYRETADSPVKATSIEFTDSEVSTSKGVKIGSSKDDVIKAYGSGYTEQGNMLRYVSGKKSLSFIMSGDTVSVISYDLDILG